MAIIPYLSKTYGIPRYGWHDRKLRYHYTDATGLIGIITTSRLWATDIRFLNDPSEGKFLPEALLSLFEAKSAGNSDREKELISSIRRKLIDPQDKSSTFSVSFCDHGDLLSQWRGYGSFGRGYALGFELNYKPHPQIGSLFDVCYGREIMAEMADDLLDIYVQSSLNWSPAMLDDTCELAASVFMALAKSFKDENYKEEQESRIVVGYAKSENYLFQDEAPIKFRSRGGDVVPYIPLAVDLMMKGGDVPKLPLRQIVVGPGIDFERNKASIHSMLEENGYEGVEIIRSAIPFRS